MDPRPSMAERLLRAAEHFLRTGDFARCRQYALRARHHGPHLAGIPQITAVSAVLSAASSSSSSSSNTTHYSVLQLDPHPPPPQHLITHQFNALTDLLNPDTNKFPSSSHALELVRRAWAVLSDPVKKSNYDSEMKSSMGDKLDTFWTLCPYCYYVYEYARVYEECCLRCQNVRCRRGFHALAIKSPPPLAAVESGMYWCMGLFPLGFDGGVVEKGSGDSLWSPFVPMFGEVNEGEAKNGVNERVAVNSGINVVEISDDSDSSLCNELVSENWGTLNRKTCAREEEEERGEGNGVDGDVGIGRKQVGGVVKPLMKRKKKPVPKSTKKLMGKGVRIEKHAAVVQNVEEFDLNVEVGEGAGAEGMGPGFDEGLEMVSRGGIITSKVEFFEGDDDIFVGLDGCF
ncbi:hypothetical protein RJ640_013054 [Escallonia rubra]|uniref:J domain-containing protein n=1 Tax=Escallonia rubra TaxID=112253 RepID=A0AA88R3A7_9ASTE|nr:hypothetical protein RJ640_013054 [Escallonia rubra]